MCLINYYEFRIVKLIKLIKPIKYHKYNLLEILSNLYYLLTKFVVYAKNKISLCSRIPIGIYPMVVQT